MLVVVPMWNSMAEVPEHHRNLSVSTNDQDTMDPSMAVEDFINTGRTGRRNAIPDISDPHIGTISTAGVDFSFDKLSMTDAKSAAPDPTHAASSGSQENNSSPSKS